MHPGRFPPSSYRTYPPWSHPLETRWKLVHLIHRLDDSWMGYFHGRMGGTGAMGSLCWTLDSPGACGCECVRGPLGCRGANEWNWAKPGPSRGLRRQKGIALLGL